jgi:hypothetical protein
MNRSSRFAAIGHKGAAWRKARLYSSLQPNQEPTMTIRTASKILSLALGATLSITWMSTIMLGMQSATAPAPATRTIELPTVVIVGHKLAAVHGTALATSSPLHTV